MSPIPSLHFLTTLAQSNCLKYAMLMAFCPPAGAGLKGSVTSAVASTCHPDFGAHSACQ